MLLQNIEYNFLYYTVSLYFMNIHSSMYLLNLNF